MQRFTAMPMPGSYRQNINRKGAAKAKTDRTVLVALVLFGMAMGYILGLWQQAAQHRHKQTCAACRAWAAEEE